MVGRTTSNRRPTVRVEVKHRPAQKGSTFAKLEGTDLLVHQHALDFDPHALDVSETAQLQRARGFLQFLRAGSNAGVDMLRTVENYYPSFGVAHRLAAEPALRPVVREFVEQMSLPHDLREALVRDLQLESVTAEVDQSLAALMLPRAPDGENTGAYGPIIDRRRNDDRAGTFVLPEGPLANTATEGINYASLVETDPRAFFVTAATDENLKTLTEGKHRFWSQLDNWVKLLAPGQQNGDVLNFMARRIEISRPRIQGVQPEAWERIETGPAMIASIPYLRTPYHVDNVVPMLRLARALGVEPKTLNLQKPDGSWLPLDQAAESFGIPKHGPAAHVAVAEELQAFNASQPKSAADKVEALSALQSTAPSAATFADVLTGARSLIVEDKLSAIDPRGLTEAQQQALTTALSSDHHVGVTAVLAGLLTRIDVAELEATLTAVGARSDEAKSWAQTAKALQALSATDQLFATDGLVQTPPDFVLLPLRVELAARSALSAAELADLFERWRDRGAAPVLRVMADWSTLRGDAQSEPMRTLVDQSLAQGKLTPEELSAAMVGGNSLGFSAEQHVQTLLNKAQGVVNADVALQPLLTEQLIHELFIGAAVVPPKHAAGEILHALHQQELEHRLPLDFADADLGGVEGGIFFAHSASERLRLSLNDKINWLPATQEGLTSFEPIEGWYPEAAALASAKVAYPLAVHALKVLQARLELLASSRFLRGQPQVTDITGANRQALDAVSQTMGPALAAAKGADAKLAVFGAGRALLDEFSDRYSAMAEEFEANQAH